MIDGTRGTRARELARLMNHAADQLVAITKTMTYANDLPAMAAAIQAATVLRVVALYIVDEPS